MPCYSPITAWRDCKNLTKNGKPKIVFKEKDATPFTEFQLPCNGCIGCRIAYSKQWAIRCTHEASLHEENSFITLTYSPEHLPNPPSLNKKHFQDFMKRFRKKYTGTKIRFFHCGEYGEKLRRPHYHACIFGFDFHDKTYYSERNGIPLYTSKALSDLWGKGFVTVGAVTYESAAYVARYVMKKINGKLQKEHYGLTDPETGEIHTLQPEYVTMSRASGIGSDWYDKYKNDIYPDDFALIGTAKKKLKVPKYYDEKYKKTNESEYELLKEVRSTRAKKHKANQTPERLNVQKVIQNLKLQKLVREI